MNRWKLKTGIAAVIILAATSLSGGTVEGTVRDTDHGTPLPGANIQILGTVLGAGADMQGYFFIDNVPPGTYTLRVTMIGYKPVVREDVRIGHDAVVSEDFRLEETVIDYNPVVVLAGKTEQQLDESHVSLSVVTARDIASRQPLNLIDALESAPGVHFVGDQINIRAANGYAFGMGNKVLLLLDGVPVYASDTGEFNWEMLPPIDIERIEIMKGAGSTLWGASALGGVINIITRSPSSDGLFRFNWTAGLYDAPRYKEWYWTDTNRLHYTREDLSYGRQMGRLGLRLSFGRHMTTGHTEVGDARIRSATGKFDYLFPGGIKWTLYGAYSLIQRGFFFQWKGPNDPYEVDETNLDNYADINQLNLYSKLAVPFSSRLGLQFRASMVRTLTGDQFGGGGNFNPAYGQGGEIQVHWIPLQNHSLTLGLQYQHDTGSTKYFGDHEGYLLGVYTQDVWQVRSNLDMTLGIRYDRYHLLDGETEDLPSPRFGLHWKLAGATHVRASIGSGFRAATIVERFMELAVMNFKIIKNESLKAEHSWAFDVGFRHYLTPEWNVDISLFDNEYWNLIEANMDLIRAQIQFRNIPRARIRGVEAAMNWSTRFHVSGINLAPSLQISLTVMDHEDLKWNDPLPYRPKQLCTVKAGLGAGPVHGMLQYRFASRIESVKVYPINERVPMHFLDGRVAWDFWKLTIQGGVQNILNYNYAPMESNLMPMRSFVVGIRGAF